MIKQVIHNNNMLPYVATYGNFELYSKDPNLDLDVSNVSLPNNIIDNSLKYDECIQEFVNSDLLKIIIKNRNVVAIMLSGSRCLGLDDEYSDYDINIIVDEDIENEDVNVRYKTIAKWKGICFHWFYNSYSKCKSFYSNYKTVRPLYFYQRTAQNKSILVFDYQKYKIIKSKMFRHIVLESHKTVIDILWNKTILPIINAGSIDTPEDLYPKDLYNLCIVYHDLTSTRYNKKATKVKRINQGLDVEITDDIKEYCYNCVKYIYDNISKMGKNKLRFEGESPIHRDFLICGTQFATKKGILKILDYKGNPRVVKLFDDYGLSCFQQHNINNKYYYSYLCQYVQKPERIISGISNCTLTITDEKLNPIKENIKMLPYGSVTDDCFCNNHGYILKDLNHYFLIGTVATLVDNVPRTDGPIYVANDIVQEQKDGQVIWQFETKDYPELYELSMFRNDYESSTYKKFACDCLHLNSIAITSDNKYMYLCYKNFGVIKIDMESKKILTIIAHKLDNKYFIGQHDIRLIDDNTFRVYNNNSVDKWNMISDIEPNKQTQICVCKLDENHNVIEYKTIDTPERAAGMLGGCILVDNENEIYDIVYSPFSTSEQFQEWSAKTNQKYCSIHLNILDPFYMYNIERGIKDYGI